jgi:ribonuclease G
MKQIIIENQPDGKRTAFVIDGRLREIFIDHETGGSAVGQIFLGVVRNILPSQFAFIDIGQGGKNAFLNIEPGQPLHTGQPVLVQVYKDASGSKGAYVGRQLNFNGRLVIVHGLDKATGKPDIGISGKITDKTERKRLRGIIKNALPAGYGAIVRTNAEGKSESDITAEISHLIQLHQSVIHRAKHTKPPVLVHQENTLLNDLLSDDIHEILIGGRERQTAFETVKQAVSFAAPALTERIFLSEDENLFGHYGINRQIKHALEKNVPLPCGGFITIEQTEACVVIDVNTGHFAGRRNYRETVLQTNLEAAACIAWELALRNLSGMIIVDFIDMKGEADKKQLIQTFAQALRKDRIKTEIVGMTELGLVQLTRKKTRESLSRLLECECPRCGGKGRVGDLNIP